jgi:RNA polymerase sigma-70 factor (ECF subfamily)
MVPADSCAAESVIKGDLETELQIALQRLSPEQKTCLILREIEGLSYREISQTLKIPINTVRTRLKRARQALLIKVHKGGEKNEL